MSFTITGLAPEQFQPLFELSNEELKSRGVIRKTADTKPGFPCRVTLEDAEPGETVLLLNYESHKAATPYRSSYAIYVREHAKAAFTFHNELPPVMIKRPIALRIFNAEGMLIGADLSFNDDLKAKIENAFTIPEADYLHAHNAAHGCFAAEIRRAR
ncbi:DUF1203 domain-containing protein [Hyphococcus flavus]|uniref:DUF1203 domain-containing protein n=1 Tax=Hyphococcus flavus TaxID=1866326 RepID=A0AAF0CG39_9PROT|nr:DUF1203 domain-containing protein [Hyphococcus flavus]WDI33071.1 DUF1203 domain-containing protein [Hyphococcus flavus]